MWEGFMDHLSCSLSLPLHSYIWQHIEIGYVQGMCDLLAPLLVILDDGEWVALLCCSP